MTNNDIKSVVKETLDQLLSGNMLKYNDMIILDQMGEILKAHYNKPDPEITQALESIKNDYYYGVLEGYYREGLTLERLSEKYNADISTIMRNKKRLCIQIYKLIN